MHGRRFLGDRTHGLSGEESGARACECVIAKAVQWAVRKYCYNYCYAKAPQTDLHRGRWERGCRLCRDGSEPTSARLWFCLGPRSRHSNALARGRQGRSTMRWTRIHRTLDRRPLHVTSPQSQLLDPSGQEINRLCSEASSCQVKHLRSPRAGMPVKPSTAPGLLRSGGPACFSGRPPRSQARGVPHACGGEKLYPFASMESPVREPSVAQHSNVSEPLSMLCQLPRTGPHEKAVNLEVLRPGQRRDNLQPI